MADGIVISRRNVLVSGAAVAAVTASGMPAGAAGKLPKTMIDGQVHVWKPDGPPPSPSGRQEPLSAEELLSMIDTGGVQRAVIITPSWSPDQNLYPLESAQKYPDRLKVMGLYFDWNKPANPAQIESWMKPEGMAGIRMFLGSEPATKWLTGGDSDWIWPILERNRIPLMISAANSLPHLVKIAEKHPGLKMCIDSFGVPGAPRGAEVFKDFGAVLAMAKLTNIIIKCGSVPYLSAEAYPYRNLQPFVKQVYDAFGPERLIFASDITLLKGSYKDCVNFWTQLDWLNDKDLALIMGGTLSKWINWPLPA